MLFHIIYCCVKEAVLYFVLSRLGNAVEELIEICLAEGKVVEAINLGS